MNDAVRELAKFVLYKVVQCVPIKCDHVFDDTLN